MGCTRTVAKRFNTCSRKIIPHDSVICDWLHLQEQQNNVPVPVPVPAKIMYSDEVTVTREGIHNTRNNHEWAAENPHATYIRGQQQRISINVWAGIVNNHVIGPAILPDRLDRFSYLGFLQHVLPDLLDTAGVPPEVRQTMWLQHDGAPAHYAVIVREYLNEAFPGRWIGRGGPVLWPARSPDLNPLDFFMWGYLRDLMYDNGPLADEEEVIARLVAASAEIKETPGIVAKVRQSMSQRVALCIQQQGGHFEHLL